MSEHDKEDTSEKRQTSRDTGRGEARPGVAVVNLSGEQKKLARQAVSAGLKLVHSISDGFSPSQKAYVTEDGTGIPITVFGETVSLLHPATGQVVRVPVAMAVAVGEGAAEYIRNTPEGFKMFEEAMAIANAHAETLLRELFTPVETDGDEELIRLAKRQGEN